MGAGTRTAVGSAAMCGLGRGGESKDRHGCESVGARLKRQNCLYLNGGLRHHNMYGC